MAGLVNGPVGAEAVVRRRVSTRFIVTGLILIVLAVLLPVGLGVVWASSALGKVGEIFADLGEGAPLPTPVNSEMALVEGRYAVYEWTGHRNRVPGGDPDNPEYETEQFKDVTIRPDQVVVTGPDGQRLQTSTGSTTSETRGYNDAAFSAAVLFIVEEPGRYQIQVISSEPTDVIIGRSFLSGGGHSGFLGPWGTATLSASMGILVFGAGLLVLGLVRRSRRPAATRPAEVRPAATRPAEVRPAATRPAEVRPSATRPAEVRPSATRPAMRAPGWYSTPAAPGRLRYWNGVTWVGPPR